MSEAAYVTLGYRYEKARGRAAVQSLVAQIRAAIERASDKDEARRLIATGRREARQ